ncbi:MAG TPA: hypothetical protein VGR95_13220 [Thermoanaerobaculia bacterium]|jgi:predicted RecA/RadA family phage recombinase|nr:hypothetical protein [Thermoanaerobaculia bacterium]
MKRHLLLFAAALLVALPLLAKNDALSLIPNDAVTVGVVKLADLRNSPLATTLFKQTDAVSSNGDAEKFLEDAGLQPSKDIDVLVVSTSPKSNLGDEAEVLVAVDGRFNVDRLSAALTKRGAVKKNGYFVLPKEATEHGKKGVVAFPDSHLVLMGSEDAVTEALASRASGGTTFFAASGLGREVSRIDNHAAAWAIVDVPRASRLTNSPHVPSKGAQSEALASAIKNVSTVAIWATDGGDALKLGAFGITHDADTLQLIEDTLRGMLAAMRLAVQDKNPEMVNVLRKFDVSHTNDTVQIVGSVPAEALKSFVAKQHAGTR